MKIKHTKFYDKLRNCKRKFRVYFSDQGLVTRKFRHFVAKRDPIVKATERKKIYINIRNTASSQVHDIVQELDKKGYIFLRLQDLGINDDAVNYCYAIAEKMQKNLHDAEFLSSLPQAKYAGKTIAYELYQKGQTSDPLIELARNSTLITIAALYIRYLPLIENIAFIYNPIHGNQQFGSQLWHRDTHHQKILKMFFSPFDISKENGPFEFFPPSLSTPRYYQDLPEGMSDKRIEACGLDMNCSIKFLSKKSEILLIDTERCLHRGGFTQAPRFLSTISYTSPLYSFTRNQYRKTGTYQLTFDNLGVENDALFKEYNF